MAFPAKLLNPGEEVAVDVRPHWKYLFMPGFAVAVVVAGCIAALVESAAQWALFVLGGVLVLCLLWLLVRYIRWATTTFVVTNERLIMREGVLKRKGREILLDRLTDISYTQSLWDRILGCGDVLLESPGRDSPETFPDLPHPVAIQNEIYRLINAHRGGPAVAGTGEWADAGGSAEPADPAQAPGAPPGASLAEQLSQLDDLRKRGVISRKEFAAKKAELLSRM
ncbi:MAG TPA: PH domain-containing protein [Acidimicrobiales bacterium]|nr:PH domain-containing protein [Acidimicrobiales bacterium]